MNIMNPRGVIPIFIQRFFGMILTNKNRSYEFIARYEGSTLVNKSRHPLFIERDESWL